MRFVMAWRAPRRGISGGAHDGLLPLKMRAKYSDNGGDRDSSLRWIIRDAGALCMGRRGDVKRGDTGELVCAKFEIKYFAWFFRKSVRMVDFRSRPVAQGRGFSAFFSELDASHAASRRPASNRHLPKEHGTSASEFHEH
jgi:hypothetical protein